MATTKWPKKPTRWQVGKDLYISVPFTWDLPGLRAEFVQRPLFIGKIIVGGPAVKLVPGTFVDLPWVEEGPARCDGALQQVNPMATRTTVGCPNRCKFCAVHRMNGGEFRELDDWPDLPILIDDNLLAASDAHIDRVMDRLERHDQVDFNQGLDANLLSDHHAERIARLRKPIVRLAMDSQAEAGSWLTAFHRLREAGVAKHKIRSYALIGFDSGPDEAWERCEWVEGHGIKVLPMWFTELDALQHNVVTQRQRELGWDDFERRRIMQWFYFHKKVER